MDCQDFEARFNINGFSMESYYLGVTLLIQILLEGIEPVIKEKYDI